MARRDATNCPLCRVMRGLAFGGMGAAIGGYGSMLFGADKNEAIYFALFGAIALTAIMQRKRDRKDS
ncbi:MAG: hypothetical protein KZQ93_11935 [Candidatus Thiodiazotropha sp. (ex Monitilora ramsayi)]|nr:hypothetical protein [Candidatus Thiodiazotropha sp. (ex Monitilora ramsayi)]